MATFVILRHYVTILVTNFTNPDNLTNDLLILFDNLSPEIKSQATWNVEVDYDTLLLLKALKQSGLK